MKAARGFRRPPSLYTIRYDFADLVFEENFGDKGSLPGGLLHKQRQTGLRSSPLRPTATNAAGPDSGIYFAPFPSGHWDRSSQPSNRFSSYSDRLLALALNHSHTDPLRRTCCHYTRQSTSPASPKQTISLGNSGRVSEGFVKAQKPCSSFEELFTGPVMDRIWVGAPHFPVNSEDTMQLSRSAKDHGKTGALTCSPRYCGTRHSQTVECS